MMDEIKAELSQDAGIKVAQGTLLGMGNPLLDISANVDADFLEKYELQPNNAILAEDKHKPMYDELAMKPDVEYIAGGATQNAIRVAQWLLGKENRKSTAYMGAVGIDKFAEKMKEACDEDGVNAKYMEVDNVATGTCGVCVMKSNRSLVANLAAANEFKIAHANENWELVEKAQVIYSAGFFITVSPDTMEKAWLHCHEKKKTYCLNLAAPFLMQVPPFKEVITKAMPYVDYLFGNETEAAEFAKSEGWNTTDILEIAKKVSLLPQAEGKKPRTVVFTQGTKSTVIAQSGDAKEHPVVPLPEEKVVDTNGAGDAYVGGFLCQLVKGYSMEKCHRMAALAACIIVQRSGCTFPKE